MAWVRELTIPTERPPLVGEVSACHAVSVTDPYGRIPGFLDWSRYFSFQEAPQLYSRGWVDGPHCIFLSTPLKTVFIAQ
jgi:hypothetical protein